LATIIKFLRYSALNLAPHDVGFNKFELIIDRSPETNFREIRKSKALPNHL